MRFPFSTVLLFWYFYNEFVELIHSFFFSLIWCVFLFTVFALCMMGLRMWVRRALLRRITAGKRSVKRIVDNTMEQVFHGGMFSLVMTSLVWISVFLYVAFYYAYVPAPSYVRPVHLQIKFVAFMYPRNDQCSHECRIWSFICRHRPCEESKSECVFPSAYVRLTRRQQLLMIGQQYKFFVQLEMPESPVNKDLGNWTMCFAKMLYSCVVNKNEEFKSTVA